MFRLKKFDPDNDDESLGNLESQCDGKDDVQPVLGSSLPADSVELMESGTPSVYLFFKSQTGSALIRFDKLNYFMFLCVRATRCSQLLAQQFGQWRYTRPDDALPESSRSEVLGGVATGADGRGVGGLSDLEETQHGPPQPSSSGLQQPAHPGKKKKTF